MRHGRQQKYNSAVYCPLTPVYQSKECMSHRVNFLRFPSATLVLSRKGNPLRDANAVTYRCFPASSFANKVSR